MKQENDIIMIEINKPTKEKAKEMIKKLCEFLKENWYVDNVKKP